MLLVLYNSILTSAKIIYELNISIIKPILKDQNKKTNDLNNIRPISISNTLSQILEKLIPISSPKLHTTHKTQFGFKSNTSCNHALFSLKERFSITLRAILASKLLLLMREKRLTEYGELVSFTN